MSDGAHLKRGIGFFGASFLVLNGLIGSGIFALPGKVALNAGLYSAWLFLLVGGVFLAVVLTFAELGSYYSRTGGPVLYAQDAFGPFVGFSTGWTIYLSRVTAFAANANVMATYVGTLHESLAGSMAHAGIVTIVTVGLTWANYLGVKDGVRTMSVFTVLKLLPLLLLILLGLGEVTGATLIPPGPFEVSELGATALLLIYAYVGFETIGVTAGETQNPKRFIPRALVFTVLAISVLYFLIMLVFVAIVPASDYGEATLVDVGRALAGPAGALVITLAAAFSIGGNLSGSMLAAPRMVFSMAEQGTLPAVFARVHEKHSTPHISILLYGALALVLALSGSFVVLAVASSVVRLLGYMVCIAALPRIRAQASDEDRRNAFRLPGGYLVPLIAMAICLWLISNSTAESWRMLGILLAIGALLYSVEKFVLKKESAT